MTVYSFFPHHNNNMTYVIPSDFSFCCSKHGDINMLVKIIVFKAITICIFNCRGWVGPREIKNVGFAGSSTAIVVVITCFDNRCQV